jgi:hypothetical protein
MVGPPVKACRSDREGSTPSRHEGKSSLVTRGWMGSIPTVLERNRFRAFGHCRGVEEFGYLGWLITIAGVSLTRVQIPLPQPVYAYGRCACREAFHVSFAW